jgi:hypothetical protein
MLVEMAQLDLCGLACLIYIDVWESANTMNDYMRGSWLAAIGDTAPIKN